MNRFHQLSVVRLLVVVAMVVAWLGVTNHCALGLMPKPAAGEAVHACCHQTAAAPEQPVPKQAARECCDSIHALVSEGGSWQAPVPISHGEFLTDLTDWAAAAPAQAAMAAFDHGPPGRTSFAEMVLQRCLFGHAPPRLA